MVVQKNNGIGKTEARVKDIRKASIVGIAGNAILSAAKIGAGLVGGSYALISDGIDSATDIITSIVTLYASRIVNQPPDENHPYGHGRAETLATKVLSFIIFFTGAQLAFSAVKDLFSDKSRVVPDTMVIYFILLSIFGKLFLALYKYKIGKRTDSSMLIADAKNMRNDVVISLSVLTGLIFTFILNLPVLDTVTALLISLWIMKSAFGLFLETSVELMDGLEDKSIYRKVFDATCSVKGVRNPHKTRIRKMNTKYIVDMEIEVDGSLSVKEGHKKAVEVQHCIQNQIDNIYDVIIHVEPFGNEETTETYGLSKKNFNGGK
ncbi:MAG: cation transporter [Spirochaetes bacterium]|nr:MAG: cation transporter [Spirochaetota bacterium]